MIVCRHVELQSFPLCSFVLHGPEMDTVQENQVSCIPSSGAAYLEEVRFRSMGRQCHFFSLHLLVDLSLFSALCRLFFFLPFSYGVVYFAYSDLDNPSDMQVGCNGDGGPQLERKKGRERDDDLV